LPDCAAILNWQTIAWTSKKTLTILDHLRNGIRRVLRILRRHRPLLLNWFRAKKQFSIGVVEGSISKAKLNTIKACGFRIYRCQKLLCFTRLERYLFRKLPVIFYDADIY
jgi:hypothetical protein